MDFLGSVFCHGAKSHIVGDFFNDAVDGVSDVLLGGDQQRGHDQDDEGGLVVKPEHIVVDADRVELDEALHRAEDIKHGDAVFGGSARLVKLYLN